MSVRSLKPSLAHVVGMMGRLARSLAGIPDGDDENGFPSLDVAAHLALAHATAVLLGVLAAPSLSPYLGSRRSCDLGQWD